MGDTTIVIPCRQMSQGIPCKNRIHWDALAETVDALPADWPRVIVTDDPWILSRRAAGTFSWKAMDSAHTVAQAVAHCLREAPATAHVAILQVSSPTLKRADYVHAAIDALRSLPRVTSVVSVVPWGEPPPGKAVYLDHDGWVTVPTPRVEPRQAYPPAYRRDGTVYAVRWEYAVSGDLYGPRPLPLLVEPVDSCTLD